MKMRNKLSVGTEIVLVPRSRGRCDFPSNLDSLSDLQVEPTSKSEWQLPLQIGYTGGRCDLT
jgi:hypothetical protein